MLLALVLAACMFGGPPEYHVANRIEIGVLDRESNRRVVSVASTGMNMDCMAIAVVEGRIEPR